MTAWVVQLDPTAVTTGRTTLDINTGAFAIGGESPGTSIDWGTAAINSYLAQAGQFGQGQVDWDIPNRTVTIPLLLGADDGAGGVSEEQARVKLQQKVGLLQREGGVLLRQRDGGPAAYLDIVYAELTLPDVWGETGAVEDAVSLVLTCLPDFYGDEIALDSISATGYCDSVLKQSGSTAVIEGDYPARCRIVVTDTSNHLQRGIFWGLRSRYYTASTPLVYEAENHLAAGGATAVTMSGASGGNVARVSSITDVWPGSYFGVVSLSSTDTGLALKHQGMYRVICRAYATGGPAELVFFWSQGGSSTPTVNSVAPVSVLNEFCLVDLGIMSLGPQPAGIGSFWQGTIGASATTSTASTMSIDLVYLVPVSECAGSVEPPVALPFSQYGFAIYEDGVTEFRSEGAYSAQTAAGGTYAPVATPLGDLPRLPPSGLEDRPVELFVKPFRGPATTGTDAWWEDNALDTFTVKVVYRPCWLSRP